MSFYLVYLVEKCVWHRGCGEEVVDGLTRPRDYSQVGQAESHAGSTLGETYPC